MLTRFGAVAAVVMALAACGDSTAPEIVSVTGA